MTPVTQCPECRGADPQCVVCKGEGEIFYSDDSDSDWHWSVNALALLLMVAIVFGFWFEFWKLIEIIKGKI